MAGIRRPKDFDVWKLGWELKRRVFASYRHVAGIRPIADSATTSDEQCGRPDLVAEGYYRFNPREFHRFLNYAKASLGEF